MFALSPPQRTCALPPPPPAPAPPLPPPGTLPAARGSSQATGAPPLPCTRPAHRSPPTGLRTLTLPILSFYKPGDNDLSGHILNPWQDRKNTQVPSPAGAEATSSDNLLPIQWHTGPRLGRRVLENLKGCFGLNFLVEIQSLQPILVS